MNLPTAAERYPVEKVCEDPWCCKNADHPKDDKGDCTLAQDDGTMPANVEELAEHVVGHKIIKAERRRVDRWIGSSWMVDALVLTLDDGMEVVLKDSDDCCAFTQLNSFLIHPELVDHIITGVGTTDDYQKWHIYADMGDVLELEVGWSCGNPFYYGYGFNIEVYLIGEVVGETQAIEQSQQKAIEQ